MSRAAEFLTGLAKTLSTMTLYRDGHPARERALDTVHERLARLQEEEPEPQFTFLGSQIVFGDRPLRELKSWDWSGRLARAGVQRLEFTGPVDRDDLEAFLDEVHRRMTDEGSTASARQSRPTNIRYGVVGLEDDTDEDGQSRPEKPVTATLDYTLGDEAETVRWLQEQMRDKGNLRALEAEALVRSLSVAMHADQAFLIPLLRLKRYDQYTTTHSLNVATLSMALAEYIGLGPAQVRSFGIAGLLHDMGKVRVPDEILNKPGKLTDQEREVMENHTVEGARMIMESEEFMDLAAVVAYEHHMHIDGGGYPRFRFARSCHQASDLIHVCDVFDALRTDRPYRDAWPQHRILNYLEERAGIEFEPDLSRAFVRMMREWESRVAEVDAEEDPLPLGADEEEEDAEEVGVADGEGPGEAAAGSADGPAGS